MLLGTRETPKGVIEEFKANDVKSVSCCALFDSVEKLDNGFNELKETFTMVPYRTRLIRIDIYRKWFTKGTTYDYLCKKLVI